MPSRSTSADIDYGTMEMAFALEKLATIAGAERIMTMLGHQDGVASQGESARAAGRQMVCTLARVKTKLGAKVRRPNPHL